MTQYPVLVYGTLRPGNHNYTYFLKGNTVHIEHGVVVPGFTMLAGPNHGFPFVVTGSPESKIVADLVYVAPDLYESVLTSLDFLEGYNPDANHPDANLYDRILVDFEVEGTARKAYMYVAAEGTKKRILDIPKIIHGDWNKRHETFV